MPDLDFIELLHERCKPYTDKLNMSASVTRSLTRFATESRYPDNVFDFAKEDAELGLKYAKEILDKVRTMLNITQERTPENKEQKNRSDDEIEGDF